MFRMLMIPQTHNDPDKLQRARVMFNYDHNSSPLPHHVGCNQLLPFTNSSAFTKAEQLTV